MYIALYQIDLDRSENSLTKAKSDYSFKQQRLRKQEEEKQKRNSDFEAQMKKINFHLSGYTYDKFPIQPLISFLPLLVRKTTSAKYIPETSRLRLPIPDTFVFLPKDEIKMWLITTEEGYLERIENFSNRDILQAAGRSKGRENELTAVMKVKVIKIISLL
jgi:hypothetical protein